MTSNIPDVLGVTKILGKSAFHGKEEKMKFLPCVKQLQLCYKHHEQILYLCSTDNQLCCSICVLEEHLKCKIVKLHTAATTIRNTLDIMQESMKDLNVKVSHAKDFWLTRNDNIESQTETILTGIKARRARFNNVFDTLEKRTISFSKTANNEKNLEYMRNRESCEQLTAEIDESLDLCDSAMKHGTSIQNYIIARKLEDRIIERAANEFNKLKSTTVKINYIPIVDETQTAGEEIGSPFLYSAKIHVDNIQYYKDSPLMLTFRAKQRSDSWLRSIDYLTDGRIVGVDHFNNKLLLFNNELVCISEHNLAVRPFSVKTLGSDNSILVTSGDANQLFYFGVTADDTLYLVRSMKIKFCCDTIAPIDEDSFFVGLFGGKKPVGVVLNNGDEMDVSVDLPEKQYTAENSKCAFDFDSKRLAVSDKNMNTLYILDSKNNEKVAIRCENIVQPRGVVYGPNGTLFICSGGTSSIVQVTTDGRVLGSHKLNVSNPYAICISRDNSQLAMANIGKDDKQLQVFDIVLPE